MPKAHGFTLVELMMAVVILGILVVIAVPNYARSVERTKCSQAMNNLEILRTAAMTYYSQNQTFVGMTIANLTTETGTTITDNNDWHYSITITDSSHFTVTATRQRGPHQVAGHTLLRLDQADKWTTSTYPYQTPTEW